MGMDKRSRVVCINCLAEGVYDKVGTACFSSFLSVPADVSTEATFSELVGGAKIDAITSVSMTLLYSISLSESDMSLKWSVAAA